MNSNCFSQWVVCLLLLAASACLLPAVESEASSETAPAPATGGNTSLSVTPLSKRAAWQQRLTLGPGDVLNLTLFDMVDSTRNDVPIGPDGRITFREARDVMAAGLTIDELRAKLDEALSKYYQNPRTIITPVAFHSKKYIVLGAVGNRGVFNFDRPLSVIEALARAGGLQTGLYGRDTVELADLGHSFLVRNGQRVPVDFERLFEQGDLSQNVPLEPDDFLYFAPASANEIYVLGQVLSPGVAAFLPRTSTMSVIAARGGFTPQAWRSRVLVVRGSLNRPETFVVDTAAILSAKAPDFKLQAKDIVYVSNSPWVKAEELLDTIATAFIQGFTVPTINRKLPPLTTSPWIK
ncbi:MAG TPA: polysaccharide biosynthesis/export family protein [Candidatus Paceibacterota bacterium]|nr:polysaccharide biosynthesis/export family protein [Verrucomicrobiota bacterium]HSA10116.1 polysaccharide biosynthesis/export family protein [Candidatus Paceibacterota bacterium]